MQMAGSFQKRTEEGREEAITVSLDLPRAVAGGGFRY